MAAANSAVAPNQSLYIQNLPEKLQKNDLRRALYMLFSTYAPVLDITALKTKRMRGQAHVLMRDVQGATLALRSCNGEEFFGREMKVSYSRNRSNTLAKMTGTFNPPATSAAAGAESASTSFPAPPGTVPAGLPPAPSGALPLPVGRVPAESAPSPAVSAGTKRKVPDGEEEDDVSDAEEDEEEGGAMEMSDDDDDD